MGRTYLVLSSVAAFAIIATVIVSFIIIQRNNSATEEGPTKRFTRLVTQKTANSTRSLGGECPTYQKGDFDCNGMIDLIDFDIWAGEFNDSSKNPRSDVNGDGKASLADYEVWRENYSK